MIKKMMFFMVSGLVLMFTSCGDQHKAQSYPIPFCAAY